MTWKEMKALVDKLLAESGYTEDVRISAIDWMTPRPDTVLIEADGENAVYIHDFDPELINIVERELDS